MSTSERRQFIACIVAAVIGWLLLTCALASVVRPGIVWPGSVGLLLLVVPGIRQTALIAWYGIAPLTADPEASDDA